MLKERRRAKHISQLQLALKLGIDRSYVSRMETSPDTCNPTVNLILSLSIELNIPRVEVFEYFAKHRKGNLPT